MRVCRSPIFISKQWVSNFHVHVNHLEICQNAGSDLGARWWGVREWAEILHS